MGKDTFFNNRFNVCTKICVDGDLPHPLMLYFQGAASAQAACVQLSYIKTCKHRRKEKNMRIVIMISLVVKRRSDDSYHSSTNVKLLKIM